MTLHRKMSSVFALAFAVISAATCVVSYYVILRNFRRVEEKIVSANLTRVRNVVNHQLDHLDATANDYATWDRTYEFMKGRNVGYVKTDLSPQVFRRYKIDVFLLFDVHGQLAFCRNFASGVPSCDQATQSQLSRVIRSSSDGDGRTNKGLLMLISGPLLMSMRPVLRTDGSGPPRGTLVMGQWIDDSEVQTFAQILSLPMTAVVASSSGIHTAPALASDKVPTEWIESGGENNLSGLVRVPDLHGGPGLLLSTQFHRDLSSQGRAAQRLMLLEIILTALVLNVAVFFMLRKLVISRVGRLSSAATLVSTTGDLSQRVVPSGNDEITILERSFNTMLTDLEESRRELLIAQELLVYSARHDGLTGVLNRAALMSALTSELSRALREGSQLGLILLDLDHFKVVNDQYGHTAGDEVLKAVVDGIKQIVRPYDTLGRYGGEEFLLLAPGVGKADALTLSERVRQGIENLPTSPPVTVSIGVAVGNGNEDPKEVLMAADEALYRAKRSGRNRVEFSGAEESEVPTFLIAPGAIEGPIVLGL